MRYKKKRVLLGAGVILFVVVLWGELFARYYMGLGTPPLYQKDATIDYMLKSNQDVHRFGNHYIVNEYGMRSRSFPKSNSNNELRVMLFGDSVLNGGVLTDHNVLATTILQDSLSQILGKNVIVGNISASSWGPGNWLAYANEYGFFDADIVGLVINSHDYKDNPEFLPLDKKRPDKWPVSALYEGFNRHFEENYLPALFSSSNSNEISERDEEAEIKKGLSDLNEFLTMAKASSDSVVVFQHWTRDEVINDELEAGHDHIKNLCKELGIITIELGPAYKQAIENNTNPFRDDIHLNTDGQKMMANIFYDSINGISVANTK